MQRQKAFLKLPLLVNLNKTQLKEGINHFSRRLDGGKPLMQVGAKRRQLQSGKIRRRRFKFHQRIAQMLDRAVPDAALQLMMRGGRLNQALHEIAPRFGVALPDFFPCFVRFPIFTGIEQSHTFRKIGAISFTQPQRVRQPGVWGRRFQPVPARRFRRGRCGWSTLRLCGNLHQNPTSQL